MCIIEINKFNTFFSSQITTAFAMLICLVFMLKSNQRASDWANQEQLYKSAIRVCPKNAKVYYNIGRLASQNGDDLTALNYYKYAIELYPNYDAALMNLGNLLRTLNQLDLAEKYIQKSIDITWVITFQNRHRHEISMMKNCEMKFQWRISDCMDEFGYCQSL